MAQKLGVPTSIRWARTKAARAPEMCGQSHTRKNCSITHMTSKYPLGMLEPETIYPQDSLNQKTMRASGRNRNIWNTQVRRKGLDCTVSRFPPEPLSYDLTTYRSLDMTFYIVLSKLSIIHYMPIFFHDQITGKLIP